MDRQLLIDRLLEAENLTDNLEDDAANTLIKWGIGQIDHLIKGVNDEEVAGDKVNDLMALMRGINSTAGNPSAASQEKLHELLERYAQTFGKAHQISEEEQKAVIEKLSQMQPGEAVKYLLDWMHPKK
jgi:hypothetical protein